MLFEDEEIGQLHLVEARIGNNGNVPVQRDDFERPISFDLGAGANPLTVDASDFQPDDLQPALNFNSHEIQLMPMLLNPGDGQTLQSFVRNLTGEVKCHYRVVGVTKMLDARAQREAQQNLRRKLLTGIGEPALAGLVAVAAGSIAILTATGILGTEKKTETQAGLEGSRD